MTSPVEKTVEEKCLIVCEVKYNEDHTKTRWGSQFRNTRKPVLARLLFI